MLPDTPEAGRELPCVATAHSTSDPCSFSRQLLPTVAFPPALASPARALVPATVLPLLRLGKFESRGGVGGKRLSTKACRASTLWVRDAMFPQSCANMSAYVDGKIDE